MLIGDRWSCLIGLQHFQANKVSSFLINCGVTSLGKVKYKDLASANNRSAWHWQITVFSSTMLNNNIVNYLPVTKHFLSDTDKSQYFAIIEFNNYYCHITLSPFFWSTKYVKLLSACSWNWLAIFTQERSFSIMHEQNIICSKTFIL